MFVAFLLILKLRESTILLSLSFSTPEFRLNLLQAPRYNANFNIFSETIHAQTQYTVYETQFSFHHECQYINFKNTTLDYRDAILIILSADSGTVCRCAGAVFLCCDPELELTSI